MTHSCPSSHFRYVSKVTLQPPHAVVTTVSNSSLFDHLDCTWSMEPGPQPGTCWLSFTIDFAFSSPLYRHVADMFFSEVVQRMMGAFEGRCRTLYGGGRGAAAAVAAADRAADSVAGASPGSRPAQGQQQVQHHQAQQILEDRPRTAGVGGAGEAGAANAPSTAGAMSEGAGHAEPLHIKPHRPPPASTVGAGAPHDESGSSSGGGGGGGGGGAVVPRPLHPRLQPGRLPSCSSNSSGLTGLEDDDPAVSSSPRLR